MVLFKKTNQGKGDVMIDLSILNDHAEIIKTLEQQLCETDKCNYDKDRIMNYIELKKYFTDICTCLDFLNFSIIVYSVNAEIQLIQGILDAKRIERYLNILTNGRDKEFIHELYCQRLHGYISCEDNIDHRRLLECKIANLEIYGVISPSLTEYYSKEKVEETISELFDIMKQYGVNRSNVIESTANIAKKRHRDGLLIKLYENSYTIFKQYSF